MKTETLEVMNSMVEHARQGNDVYPFMWQPRRGRSNTVSAAIREAKKRGLLEVSGKDGIGNPIYRAVMPKPTHATPTTVN